MTQVRQVTFHDLTNHLSMCKSLRIFPISVGFHLTIGVAARNNNGGTNNIRPRSHQLQHETYNITTPDDEDYNLLIRTLEQNPYIERLKFRKFFVDRNGRLANLANNMIKGNKTLTMICLSNNGISDDVCVVLANALQGHPTVKYLDLSNNNNDTSVFSQEEGSDLSSLNNIGQRGCQALADKVLKCNTALTNLNLSYNKSVDGESCKILAEALALTKEEMNIGGGSVVSAANDNKKIKTASTTTTTRSSNLARLNLGFCNIGDRGCIELSKMLRTNTNLKVLKIEYNNITERQSLQALHGAMTQNFSLLRCSMDQYLLVLNSIDRRNAKDAVLSNQIDLLCKLNGKESRKIFAEKETFTHQDCVEVLIDVMIHDDSDKHHDHVQVFFVLLSLRPELCDIRST